MGEVSFNPIDFIDQLGIELVIGFKSGELLASPGEVGKAREEALSEKLERVFGDSVFLKNGFIFDSYAAVSLQQDIVFSERSFGLSFAIGSKDGPKYFPCETTIAAGEVKSTLKQKELTDIFLKCASVKVLKRKLMSAHNPAHSAESESHRKYGSPLATGLLGAGKFDQNRNVADQIFYFAVCGVNKVSSKKIFETYKNAYVTDINKCPDLLISLDGLLVTFFRKGVDGVSDLSSRDCADGIFISKDTRNPFSVLVSGLRGHLLNGRTVPLEVLGTYFDPKSNALGYMHHFSEPFSEP